MWFSRLGNIGNIINAIFGLGTQNMGSYFNIGEDPLAGTGQYFSGSGWGSGVSGRLIPPYVNPYAGVNYIPHGDYERQHGGYVSPGNLYGVNERGVEAFMATRAGIIIPREAMLLSPPDKTGGTSIDNSRHLSADVSLLSPDQLTPIVRTEIRSLLTDEILRIGF